MDWRVFVLFLLVVKICYGGNTCKTNPSDDKCYCVLDDKYNWYEAVSFCQEQEGILVDINSQNTNDFLVSFMAEASVTDAWVGVKGDSSSATSVSDPSTAISYTPAGNTPLDSSSTMCASIITSSGNWVSVECSGSGIQKSTICRLPTIDSSGYTIDTGCPYNGFLHGSKCYQIFTWTTGKVFTNAYIFCKAKTPGGKLILPTSDDEYQFILKVGQLSGLDKFWIRVEYTDMAPHYKEYGTNNFPPYVVNALTTAALGGDSSGSVKYVINVVGRTWEKQYKFNTFGVMCEFDVGTPGVAEPSVCPAPDSVTTDAAHSTVASTTVPKTTVMVTTGVVSTADVSTTAPKVPASTSTPNAAVSTAVVATAGESTTTPKVPASTSTPNPAVSTAVETTAGKSTTAPKVPASTSTPNAAVSTAVVTTAGKSTTAPKVPASTSAPNAAVSTAVVTTAGESTTESKAHVPTSASAPASKTAESTATSAAAEPTTASTAAVSRTASTAASESTTVPKTTASLVTSTPIASDETTTPHSTGFYSPL